MPRRRHKLGRTWQAACPAGSLLIAGGGRLNGGDGQVLMDTMVPVFGATDVYSVTGREDDAPGFAGNWSITATALCAQPPAGWEHAEMTGVDLISDTQVRMTAAEDEDGFAGNWAPRAYAICA